MTATQSPLKPLPRLVFAPPPQGCVPSNASPVLSVVIEDNEEVEWIWTHGPQGSYVSGYRIVKAGIGIADDTECADGAHFGLGCLCQLIE